MADEMNTSALEEIAGRVGRLQAEIMCLENFLKTINDRHGVPDGIKSGAAYYLKSINELREAGDI